MSGVTESSYALCVKGWKWECWEALSWRYCRLYSFHHGDARNYLGRIIDTSESDDYVTSDIFLGYLYSTSFSILLLSSSCREKWHVCLVIHVDNHIWKLRCRSGLSFGHWVQGYCTFYKLYLRACSLRQHRLASQTTYIVALSCRLREKTDTASSQFLRKNNNVQMAILLQFPVTETTARSVSMIQLSDLATSVRCGSLSMTLLITDIASSWWCIFNAYDVAFSSQAFATIITSTSKWSSCR